MGNPGLGESGGRAALWLVSACLFALGTAAAQQTLTVGAGGTFSTITAAINAATPGDTVVVNGGVYGESLDIDLGIRLVGRGAQLRTGVFIQPLRIHDVPAGQVFSMVGFATDGSTTSGDVTINIVDCDGVVSLQGLEQNGLHRWWLTAVAARQLHVGQSALRFASITDSTTVFEGCGFDPNFLAGLSIDGGRTAVVDCVVHGSSQFGAPAIQLASGELALTRGQVYSSAASAPAIVTNGGVILHDPSTVLTPTGNQPAIVGPAAVGVHEFASLVASTDGQALTMAAHGPAGDLFATLMSLPGPVVPTAFGSAWVDPTNFVFVTHAAFPNGRLHSSALVHPTLPPGWIVALQLAHLSAAGVGLSTPVLVSAP